jgi:hypothetical protein
MDVIDAAMLAGISAAMSVLKKVKKKKKDAKNTGDRYG